MANFCSALLRVRWNAGEVLPGHQFKIHDFAVLKEKDCIVLLDHVARDGTLYRYIVLESLECAYAPIENFIPPPADRITQEYKVLREKLIRIMGYAGQKQWQRLRDRFLQRYGTDKR